jgi:hypothetical protein
LVAVLPRSKLGRNSFQVLCTDGIVVVGWRRKVNGKCNILVENVSAAFPTNEKAILMMPFMPGFGEYMADQIDVNLWL